MSHTVSIPDEHHYCTFHIDDLFVGVDVRRVQEVLSHLEMTRVPLAPDVVGGLINLRGQIVTAIDLRRRLQLPQRPDGEKPMNVVVTTGEGPVSLLVDQIGDVLELEPELFERCPETARGAVRELITGVYKLEGRLLLILDVARAIQLDAAA